MPGVRKQKKVGVDSSIGDAAKAIKSNKNKKQKMLDQLSSGTRVNNELDDLNDRLNNGSEPDSVRKIFDV
jgi:hypothetical protein